MARTPHDVLKAAVTKDHRSIRQIAREAGMAASGIVRFVSGERGLSSRAFDRLTSVLGLELRPRQKDGS